MHAVLGIRSTDRKEAMEYGSIYHKITEVGANMGNTYTKAKMVKYMSDWIQRRYPQQESVLLAKIAVAQYHLHREWMKSKPSFSYIEAEPVFAEPYKLPPLMFSTEEIQIRVPAVEILLRGRIDGVIEVNGELWLEENKTKSRIDMSALADTIPENIQVMFYAVAASIKYKRRVKGVIYNVIRKPGQRQRQKESDEEFVKRIEQEIVDNPNYYFHRLAYSFPSGAIEKWKREELNPLLYHIYLWWRSIEKNPTDPWKDVDGNVNPFHGRRSFGIYDPMSNGKGDFFDLIVHGRKSNYTINYELFPELQDDD